MNTKEIKTNSESKWNISAKRYVAFIDIMGFKDMVARLTHEEIYELMKRIEGKKNFIKNISWGDGDSELIRSTTYSDSIIIYSKEDSYDSLYSLICTVAAITNELFLEGIPHKGAIAFGLMTLDTDNSIFFGQPLIDAYLLEEELNFYGIVVHASAETQIDTIKRDPFMPFTKNYLCPFKNGSSMHLTIMPITAGLYDAKDNEQNRLREELFESIRKLRYKTSGHLRKYIDTTKLYLNIE